MRLLLRYYQENKPMQKIFKVGERIKIKSYEKLLKACSLLKLTVKDEDILEGLAGRIVKINQVAKDYRDITIYYTEEDLCVGHKRLLYLYSNFVEEIPNKMTFSGEKD